MNVTFQASGWLLKGKRAQEERTFLCFLMVTRWTPGTGFIPSFCIAFRLFFSLRLCFARAPSSPGEHVAEISLTFPDSPNPSQCSEIKQRTCSSFLLLLVFLLLLRAHLIFIFITLDTLQLKRSQSNPCDSNHHFIGTNEFKPHLFFYLRHGVSAALTLTKMASPNQAPWGNGLRMRRGKVGDKRASNVQLVHVLGNARHRAAHQS